MMAVFVLMCDAKNLTRDKGRSQSKWHDLRGQMQRRVYLATWRRKAASMAWVRMLEGEQTFKVTRTVDDSQDDNFIRVWQVENKVSGKTCDGYAASATQLGGIKVAR